MGGEDFAYFAQKVPSAFIFVGIANNKSEPVIKMDPLSSTLEKKGS